MRRIISFVVPIFFFLFFIPSSIHAVTYYISPTGNDSNAGTSESQPLATFNKAWEKLFPGDTLILLDGTYTQTLRPNKRNGEPGNPITIKAKNDGKVIIDGQKVRVPVQLGDTWPGPIGNWFVIEGVVAKNGDNEQKWDSNQQRWYLECNGNVWCIQGSNNILRRISGYNASVDGNSMVIYLGGHYNTAEDCVAAGSGRKMILSSLTGSHNIIRRCFAGAQEWNGANFCPAHWPWMENIETYNSSGNIIENSIGYGIAPRPGGGINVFGQSGAKAENNHVLGSIAMRAGMNWDGSQIDWSPCPAQTPSFTSCTTCANYSSWTATHRSGFHLGNPNAGLVQNNRFQDVFSYGNAGLGFGVDLSSTGSNNKLVRATVVNNGIGVPIRSGWQNVNFDTTQTTYFDIFQDNNIQGTTYQGGGARIKYRYESYFDANNNPVINLTNIPLWPWPMEDRIRAEFATHLSMYHGQTPELANFSVTNTLTPILTEYGVLDELVVVPTPTGPTSTPVPTNTPTPTPLPITIPGKIEAESYIRSQGTFQVKSTTDEGGGYKIGGITAGAWTEYSVSVPTTGEYTLSARVASDNQTINKSLTLSLNGVSLGTIEPTYTGGWDTFTTIAFSNPVMLSAGTNTLRLTFDTGYYDINYVLFSSASTKPGDVNGDGIVNITDLSTLLSNFGKTGVTRSQGDLNGDGIVNLMDLSLLLANFGK